MGTIEIHFVDDDGERWSLFAPEDFEAGHTIRTESSPLLFEQWVIRPTDTLPEQNIDSGSNDLLR